MAKRSKAFDLIIGMAVLSGAAVMAIPSPNDKEGPAPSPVISFSNLNESNESLPLIETAPTEETLTPSALDWGRNPFQAPAPPPPLVVEIEPEPEPEIEPADPGPPADLPVLKGISAVDGRHMAIIDRTIVKRGDVLASGFRVTEITDTAVHVEREGRVYPLQLERK